MTDTAAVAGLTPQAFDDKFFTEYFQQNRFKSDMGKTPNSIIQVKEDLSKEKGDSITYALVNRLSGAGVTGNTDLEGSEEEMDTRSFALTINQRRNAVRVSDWDEQKSSISLRESGREALMDWAQESTIAQIVAAMGSINGTAYGSADATARDIWMVDNVDRVLCGATISNYNVDHSAALATVDGTNDKLTSGRLSLMKRIALTASPKIRPLRSESSGRRYYCAYVNPLTFRDLKEDTVITNAQRDVGIRMQNEKLFNGGDIVWDGVIVKECDTIPTYAEGTASAVIAPVFFCGAQAVGYGIAKRWKTVTEEFDYGDKHGVAVREMGGFAKLTFGSGSSDVADLKDHGMVTGWFSAAADA